MGTAPLILLAAGGTGGHLFPAEALGVELIRRGLRVRLATDSRALRYSGLFSSETIDVVPSETVSLAGGRRQPGRAGDGRYRSRRDRAARAFAVEPAHPHATGARRGHGARARGL